MDIRRPGCPPGRSYSDQIVTPTNGEEHILFRYNVIFSFLILVNRRLMHRVLWHQNLYPYAGAGATFSGKAIPFQA